MANAIALLKLRQNVTSKLRAASRWRVTTPAMLHSRVTRTISAKATSAGIRSHLACEAKIVA